MEISILLGRQNPDTQNIKNIARNLSTLHRSMLRLNRVNCMVIIQQAQLKCAKVHLIQVELNVELLQNTRDSHQVACCHFTMTPA